MGARLGGLLLYGRGSIRGRALILRKGAPDKIEQYTVRIYLAIAGKPIASPNLGTMIRKPGTVDW